MSRLLKMASPLALLLCAVTAGCYSTAGIQRADSKPIAYQQAIERYEFEKAELKNSSENGRLAIEHYSALEKRDRENSAELASLQRTQPEIAKQMRDTTAQAKIQMDRTIADHIKQSERVKAALAKVRELEPK